MQIRYAVWGAVAIPVLGIAAGLSACGSEGEDRPNVDVIAGGGGTGSVSGEEPAVTLGTGYRPSTNQDQNLALGLDLKDIRALMSGAARNEAVDWAAATALYENGKNQTASGGAPRSLASLAVSDANSVFPNGTAVYGRANIIDGIIRDGLTGSGRAAGLSDNGRRQLVDKGIQVLMYALGRQQLSVATTSLETSPANAAAAVDAAWAFVTGTPDSNGSQNNGLIATATTREEDFQLAGKVAPPLQVSFQDALFAAQKNNPQQLATAIAAVRGYANAIFYLSTLRNIKLLPADSLEANRELHLAEGWTYWQAIRATVAGVDAPGAAAVEAAFMRNAAEPFPAELVPQLFATLNAPAVLSALGIPEEIRVVNP